MIDSTLYHRLSPVTRRLQILRALLTVATVWILAGMTGLVLWWLKWSFGWYSLVGLIVFLSVTTVLTLVGLWFAFRTDDGFVRTARQLERRFPDLDSTLLTAIEQQPRGPAGSLGFLQTEVIRNAVYHGYQNPWQRVVPQWQLLVAGALSVLGLLVLLISAGGQFFSAASGIDVNRMVSGLTDGMFGDGSGLVVEPGNTEVERGTSLLVLARFAGREMPGTVELVFGVPDGPQHVLEMPRSLQDPVFGVRIPSVDEPISYQIRYDETLSGHYQVDVFDYPRLLKADAVITPPEFSAAPVRTVEDVRRLTAVRNSHLSLKLKINKPVAAARLIAADGQQINLEPRPDDLRELVGEFPLLKSDRYVLELRDDQQRENQEPPVFTISVLDNQRPKIERSFPLGDLSVSSLQEIDFSATVWDDAGIQRAGLTWTTPAGRSGEIVLGESVAAGQKQKLAHTLALEDLQAREDDLLTFHLWAEDLGPDGTTRRTEGDLQFAEVRPFDEVYRQGQQPAGGQAPGGQGGQSSGSDQLINLQKQIINATWNLIRREPGGQPATALAEDIGTVAASQQAVRDQLQTALAEITDEAAQVAGNEAAGHMNRASGMLEDAARQPAGPGLRDAVAAEQAAYAGLLRLRQREYEVARSQQNRSGGGGGGSRSQQQLQQLQLENDENRYQTEQQAREQAETEQQREDRQILSRLRELARRQQDLNQRIRELQSALQEASTPEEQQELTGQLKRLQSEQEQILRDTEELQQRMQQPDNQSRMSEQLQQLEQARENVRQSNESLQNGQAGSAAAEGTRAQRQLRELRDDFQKRASGQFDDQIQQMRNRARDIEAEQDRISAELNAEQASQPGRPSLAEGSDREELGRRLKQQRDQVRNLEQEMRDLVVEAEEVEPIMSERLYDAWRGTRQFPPDNALDWAAQSLQRGFDADARAQNEQASAGIQRLREGVDSAAEAVLGNETDALRRASQELQRLTAELQGESGRARQETDTGERPPGQASGQAQPDSSDRSANRREPGESRAEGGAATPDRPDASRPAGRDPVAGAEPAGQQPAGEEPARSNPGEPLRDGNPDAGRADGPPSLDNRLRNDQRGVWGGQPQLNYDNRDDGLAPLTGDDYLDWSDRLRDVEEMVADPGLRAEASRIREEARTIRGEVRRHSREPNWELVQLRVIRPLVELQDRVHEELLRRSGEKLLVPIDRDPVPPRFEEAVREYYEQLGRGQ